MDPCWPPSRYLLLGFAIMFAAIYLMASLLEGLYP